MSHAIVTEDARYVELVKERRRIEAARTAFADKVSRAELEHSRAMRQYELDLSRATGDEEMDSLERPEEPAILTSRPAVEAEHRKQLETNAAATRDLHAVLSREKSGDFQRRKQELRAKAREILHPVVGELDTIVRELNDLIATQNQVLLAGAISHKRGPKMRPLMGICTIEREYGVVCGAVATTLVEVRSEGSFLEHVLLCDECDEAFTRESRELERDGYTLERFGMQTDRERMTVPDLIAHVLAAPRPRGRLSRLTRRLGREREEVGSVAE